MQFMDRAKSQGGAMKHSIRLFVLVTLLAGYAFAGSVSGKVTASGKGATVVYLESTSGAAVQAASKPVVVDQKGLLFQPHVVVVTVGTTVEFLNSDTVAHNVFWPSVGGDKKLGHNLGTWPKGEKRSFKFDHPGVVSLLCNVHPEMSGFVVVSPSPYYAEADAGGTYKIENVPDGAYTLWVWHEGGKPQSKPIRV